MSTHLKARVLTEGHAGQIEPGDWKQLQDLSREIMLGQGDVGVKLQEVATVFAGHFDTRPDTRMWKRVAIRRMSHEDPKYLMFDYDRRNEVPKIKMTGRSSINGLGPIWHYDPVKLAKDGTGDNDVSFATIIPATTDHDAQDTITTIYSKETECTFNSETKQLSVRPRGWEEHHDSASGRYFWHNAETGVSQWLYPHPNPTDQQSVGLGEIMNVSAVMHAPPNRPPGQDLLFIRITFSGKNLLQAEVHDADGEAAVLSNLRF